MKGKKDSPNTIYLGVLLSPKEHAGITDAIRDIKEHTGTKLNMTQMTRAVLKAGIGPAREAFGLNGTAKPKSSKELKHAATAA